MVPSARRRSDPHSATSAANEGSERRTVAGRSAAARVAVVHQAGAPTTEGKAATRGATSSA